MAPEKSTKPSSESSAHPESARRLPELELPDETTFRSLPPLISMAEFIKRNRELRKLFPKGLPTHEERWAAKRGDIFEL